MRPARTEPDARMSETAKAVFLSYASQDAEAAKRICDALRAAGVEVWFDADGGLEHGDEWDAKIRRQIKECVLFIAVISANTQAREEGYFRIEWDLAAERARGIASGVAFILPVVIDATREPDALVPDRFRAVQWTKLPGGNVPPEVLQRFLKLWSHRTGALKHAGGVGAPLDGARSEANDGRRQATPLRKSTPMWPWVALGLVAVVVAYLIFKPRRGPEEIAKIVADAQKLAAAVTPPAASASPPALSLPSGVSEARQLVAKAYVLLRGLEATREDFALAEEYCQRALKLDPDDGEVWAAYSQLNSAFVYRGWDASPARKEQTRAMAERAVRLAPKSVEARLAQAGAWSTFGINRDEREKLLREIVHDEPDNQGALRFLAVTVLAKPGGLAECLALNERSAALPGGDPLALLNNARYLWTRGQSAQGYAVLQRALAQKVFTSALVLKMAMEVSWRGDLAAAEATLRQIPQSALQEDRANYNAGLLRYFQRDPGAALEIWQAFPRDYYVDFIYEGPKGLLLGLADELDHRDAAAKIEWRTALQLVEKKIAAAPNNPAPYFSQAYLLACLGEKAAAGETLRTYEQLAGLKYTAEQPMPIPIARVYARLGRFDEIFAHSQGGDHATLRFSPDFEALRADPRFAGFMVASERAEPARAMVVRDWPKNPELKKAIDLTEGLGAIPDDLALAEEIAKRALDRSPTDVEAVTVMARVQSHFLIRGFDRSDERAALAKRYAERALQLAPDEPEAMYALATYHFSRTTGETALTERLLRRAMELDSSNPRFGRLLADLLNATNRPLEAIAQGQDNVRRFPQDVLSHYDLSRNYKDQGRYDEFDRELDATLALAPLANAIVWKARLQFGLRNDFAGMKTWLDRVPARVRGTERAVFGYFLYAAFGGAPETGLGALRDFPQKWFTDFEYAGPTALLNASLLELQGKKELALRQYEVAQGEIQRMRQTDPARIGLSQVEFWTLLGLGRIEEAKASHRRVVEGSRRPYVQDMVNGWWFTVIPGALLIGDRATAITLLRESVETRPESRAAFRLRFRIDPRMAPFRADPEITALLAEPEAKK